MRQTSPAYRSLPLGDEIKQATSSPGRCPSASTMLSKAGCCKRSRGSSFTITSVSLGCGNVQSPASNRRAAPRAQTKASPVSGTDFIGGIATLRDADGQPATARIDRADRDASDPTGVTFPYTLTYRDSKYRRDDQCVPSGSGRCGRSPATTRPLGCNRCQTRHRHGDLARLHERRSRQVCALGLPTWKSKRRAA